MICTPDKLGTFDRIKKNAGKLSKLISDIFGKGMAGAIHTETVTITSVNLERWNTLLLKLRLQQARVGASVKTIEQIGLINAFNAVHQDALTDDTVQCFEYFTKFFIVVNYVMDAQERGRIWIEVVDRHTLETKETMPVTGLVGEIKF